MADSHNMTSSAVAAARATIAREAEALRTLEAALAGPLGVAFVAAFDIARETTGRVIITGMGKSAHIARKIAATLASTGRPSYFVHPAEASHGDLGMIAPGDSVLAISRNGESAELADILHHCRRLEIPLIAMTFKPESTLGEAADVVLSLPDCGEASGEVPAPTTSTTMCLALGDALAMALLDAAGFTSEHYKSIHPGGRLGAMLKHVRDVMRTGDDLPLVNADASTSQMIEAMSRLNSKFQRAPGAVGVVEEGALIGIFVDGDLRRHLVNDTLHGRARDLMHPSPHTIAPEKSLADAMALLNQHRINVAFVVDAGKVVGMVHVQDLLAAGVR